jgi:hypothetical protein
MPTADRGRYSPRGAQLLRIEGGKMGGMWTTGSIGAILSIAALLGCLSLAQPVDARATQVAGLRDSVVPIVVDAPSQGSAAGAERADYQPGPRANDATPGFDFAVESPTDLLTPLADVPWAAWLLLGTCVLCARFGPRALRRFEDEAEETTDPESDQTRKLHKTTLTPPRRSTG